MAKKTHQRNFLKLKDPNDILDFGRLVAEKDGNLAQYYVSPERFVKRATNIEDAATFFVGPKGIGKSAILQMVRLEARATGKRIVDIRPDDLAFSALANAEATSPILGDASQHQWLFKALWDYVLSLEVLRQEYPDASALTGWFSSLFQGHYEKEAKKLIALSQGGGMTLTNRILQLINEIELSGEYSGGKVAGKVTLDKAKSASGDAFHLLGLVNSVAKKLRDNVSHCYYLLIDDLDLYWNDSPTQNAFIAALFSSLSHFSRPPSLKAVVALRDNIYEALPIVDRDKFHDVVCNVKWDLASVRSIVEQRLVFKLQVKASEVWGGVFPENAFNEIWQNSNGRPREAIRLVTLAVQTASGNGHLSVMPGDLASAIRTFSNERITEIASEHAHTYPDLERVVRKMSGWPKEFPIQKLIDLLELLDFEVQMKEPWADRYSWVSGFASNPKGFAQVLLECGVLWLKQSRTDQAAPLDRTKPNDITDERWFAIHPMFAPGLGLVGS
jgi:hypothetical protein